VTELPECLATSITLRIPVVDPAKSLSDRIAEIESYLLLAAFNQGQLAEERLRVHQELREMEYEWATLEGWEALRGRARTNASIDDAKRQLQPDLWKRIESARWLIKRVTEEYDRLDSDGDRCSRLLTPARLDSLIPTGAFVD
jgi:hypothetical protein